MHLDLLLIIITVGCLVRLFSMQRNFEKVTAEHRVQLAEAMDRAEEAEHEVDELRKELGLPPREPAFQWVKRGCGPGMID